VALHVVLGGLYLALAPFQFVKRIRSRHLGYHRWAGRVLVSIGVVVGATGVFMGMFIPIAGWIERGYIGVFGALFVVALVKGFVHIRAGRVALHREWMIQAFAIGLAVATQRLIFIRALLAVADPTQGPVAMRGVYADGDTVVVLWDGEGTRRDGKPYKNTYAWFMRFDEGLVVEATAFFDSIAFNELWSEVSPTD
jgi:uncharacterized membrane protein YozB (DUF420 family)